jgi:hypothetical protein
MLIDLAVAGLLSAAGGAGLVVMLLVGLLVLRVSPRRHSCLGRLVAGIAIMGTVLVLLLVASGWWISRHPFDARDLSRWGIQFDQNGELTMEPGVADSAIVARAQRSFERVRREMRDKDVSPAQIEQLASLVPELAQDLAPLIARLEPGRRASLDTLWSQLATSAPEEREAIQQRISATLVRAAVQETEAELQEVREERDRAREDFRELEENPGLRRILGALADDLGISMGWVGLYFTLLTAIWRGRTLGKRLLGIRVVRLDGSPIDLWSAFGRFGGYAAGLVTGLLGFAQVIWDPNRQAIHDKVSGTVVVKG